MSHISVVVPVYQAESCLRELYRRLTGSLQGITDDFSILLVEDCGTDRSWKIIEELASTDRRVEGIKLSRNFGQHIALTAGLDRCDSDWVIVMDCDLQDRPEEIPRLYAKAQEGYDIVLALRRKRQDSLFKRLTSSAFYRVFRTLSGTRYDGRVGSFRIISRRVASHLRSMRERLRFFGALVDWMGFPTAGIEVEHNPRFQGESSYTFRKRWNLATAIVIAHSENLLRMTTKLGFVLSGVAFVYGLYFLIKAFLFDIPIMGWASLIVSLYFLGGVIIMILGVLGIYLQKVFDEVRQRPLYLIAESTSDPRPRPEAQGAARSDAMRPGFPA